MGSGPKGKSPHYKKKIRGGKGNRLCIKPKKERKSGKKKAYLKSSATGKGGKFPCSFGQENLGTVSRELRNQ